MNLMLSAGKKIGPYEIVEPIGAGGMGEVYCAKDSRLSRQIAIKLLPSRFSDDAETLRRFRKEAEAVGSLNHPNILTVHDVGVQDGVPYLVTELLQGETLRHCLAKGKLEVSKTADFALQLANGLAAAHEKGIIHRDLKPENLFITKEGRLKILDFGLAKLTEKQISESEITEAPTASALTEAGIILGTVAYMSPEQVKADPVDHRSDIFSFGSILYEMIIGRRAFSRESNVGTMNAILHQQPAFSSEVEESIPGLVRIVKRCLEKESDHRFQSAMDIAFALEAVSGSKVVSAISKPKKSIKYGALAFGFLIVSVVGLVLFMQKEEQQEKSTVAPVVLGFQQLTNQPGEETRGNISPDGKNFVYSAFNERDANWDIYLQRVGGRNRINLTDSCEQDDNDPAFSPDGEQIAFRSSCEGGGIFLMGATGESVKRISNVGANPSWSFDGKQIAFASTSFESPWLFRASFESKIWIFDVASGQKRSLSALNAIQPSWSPSGSRIAYWTLKGARRDIWTISSSGASSLAVTNDPATDCNPIWSPDGKYLYFSSDRGGSLNLWRVKIEEQTGKALSLPEPVTTPSAESNYLSFSKNGKDLLFSSVFSQDNIEKLTFDPEQEKMMGPAQSVTTGTKKFKYPDPSPDGKWLACSSWGEQHQDIYIMHPDGTNLRQLTNDAYVDRYPKWSHDGNKIAFYSARNDDVEIWSINRDGTGLQQLTDTMLPTVLFPLWSPDDSKILALRVTSSPIIFDLKGNLPIKKWEPLPDIPETGEAFNTFSWSADGKWLAGLSYIQDSVRSVFLYSFETKKYIRLSEFPGERNWQFGSPVWLHDSRRLMFGFHNSLLLVDSKSRKSKTITTFPRNADVSWFRVSHDDRTIYYQRATTEGDIWLMKFK